MNMEKRVDGIELVADVVQQVTNYEQIPSEVVISGISGRFPESSTIKEFKDNLFNGIDMVNDDPKRWPGESPMRIGKIKDKDLESFDCQFFDIHQRNAEFMDPQMRMIFESTYEAIVDAGFNPRGLRGSHTGVYIGISKSNIEDAEMVANRLSLAFDFKGPNYVSDESCLSSFSAMSQAFADLKAGNCEAAIVAGSNLISKSDLSSQLKRLDICSQGMLQIDGKRNAIDETASGYVRSEGCVVIFMQKSSQARRVYSTVLNVRTNASALPNEKMHENFLRETYDEIKINPADVTYVEVDGNDSQELHAITDLFCKNRAMPLLIGSVKSNMGHSEAASGLCAIVKVLLAMEADAIPGNLHFNAPNDSRVKVVDRNTPWSGGIVGVNSFGFDGACSAHVILKSNSIPKSMRLSDDTSPRLVVVSGRTNDEIDSFLNEIIGNKMDDEYLSLINGIYEKTIPLHYYRGYAVVGETCRTMREIGSVMDTRPIWYIYSGMGSQWASMAKDLMQFDVFRNSIDRCADVLRPQGMDLIELLTRSDDISFENVLNSYVAICAVQIGLTDVLTYFEISPNGIVGHSSGEISCAYADGCLTAEQTILIAYWEGYYFLNSNLENGMMAAVGLSWDDTKARLPSDIYAACDNCGDSVTISGPSFSITAFVEHLKAERIFAKAVNSSGCAFHSKYMSDVVPKLRDTFDVIIPKPKNRSSRWLSTSVPESKWSTPTAQQCSAAYYLNNITSPVLFYGAIQKIPKNAICIEIAPTGLLPVILKRALGNGTINLSLLKRGHPNNMAFLLSNIGKLYAAGAQPAVSKLYESVSYPVGRGTPMLNSSVSWDHSQRFMASKSKTDFKLREETTELIYKS